MTFKQSGHDGRPTAKPAATVSKKATAPKKPTHKRDLSKNIHAKPVMETLKNLNFNMNAREQQDTIVDAFQKANDAMLLEIKMNQAFFR